MDFNLLDWILVALVLAYALSGYWQGFITGAFATIGLILGGLLGIWLVPLLLDSRTPSVGISLLAVFIVLVCASVGQAGFQYAGSRVRSLVTWQPARSVDAVGGAVLSMAAVLVVSWMLGVGVSNSRIPTVGPLVRDSQVLGEVDKVMPSSAQSALRTFTSVMGTSFPSYLEPFAPERIVRVAPAPGSVLRDPEIQAARDSVYKLRSNNRCGRGVEGTGFTYAPGRIMTNAHVVAGVRQPMVEVGGRLRPGTVVYFNPDIDVAVVAVDGLGGTPLRFAGTARSQQVGAALGFPLDGPYDAAPVRIRTEQTLRSADIYGQGVVTREVYSLRGQIRPGNSGGPLVDRNGRVTGVVFAASVADPQTGYALTAGQVARAATLGIERSAAVDTQDCA